MSHAEPDSPAPRRGDRPAGVRLPGRSEEWADGGWKSVARNADRVAALVETLAELDASGAWRWPRHRQLFVTDPHADPAAFVASLVAAGAATPTGTGPCDFSLTGQGERARFILGGDYLDKGPENLGLLRSVRHLTRLGARVKLLAGNHDVRFFLGIEAVGRDRGVLNEHLFIRTGHKIVPLLREVWDGYLTRGRAAKRALADVPGAAGCRRLLYPGKRWFDDFPVAARAHVGAAQIDRELSRVRVKCDRFEAHCADHDMSLAQVCAAITRCRELFVMPCGEFAWLHRSMRAAHRAGSFLFVHAGLDDSAAALVHRAGVAALNATFRAGLAGDPFTFYYGSMGNLLRTKYRNSDRPFSRAGARQLREAGVAAVVHGHRNLRHGQRLAGRQSMLNFEADTSLDRRTRKRERIAGPGAGVTIVDPAGRVIGISTDHPAAKVFEPGSTLASLTRHHPDPRSKA